MIFYVYKGLQSYPLLSTVDQPSTPYSEVRILSGHTGTVHQIAVIDEERYIICVHSVLCDIFIT